MAINRRRICIFAALAIAPAPAFVLSGCSDSETPSGSAATDPTQAASDDTDPTNTTSPVDAPEPDGEKDMAALLAPGALPDKALGDDTAPVTIIEYSSMTCPHCASFHKTTFPDVVKQYVETGKVRFIHREFPLDPRATAASMLARCAGDNYFPMLDLLFAQQQVWGRAPQNQAARVLYDTVKIAGFSQESFDACLKDQQLLDNVNATRNRAAQDFEVTSTPTFFVNGKKYSGALPFDQFSAIIEDAM